MVTGLQHAKKHPNIKMGTFYQRKLKGKKWEKRANKLIYKHDCQAKSMFYMYILDYSKSLSKIFLSQNYLYLNSYLKALSHLVFVIRKAAE